MTKLDPVKRSSCFSALLLIASASSACAAGFAGDPDASRGSTDSAQSFPDTSVPLPDSGGRDASVLCGAGLGDCDNNPANGCETPLTTDTNCGACARTCNVSGGQSCSGGVCSLSNCPTGTGDCDGNGATCEQMLNTNMHCGACNTACSRSNASASCAGGTCAFVSCNTGFGNCDNNDSNGCETALTTNTNCGGCGMACGVNDARMCSGGVCSLAACPTGTADCDNDGVTCEQTLRTNVHCGSCNAACAPANASGACGDGTCRVGTCNTGFGNCDGNDGNGCETPLTSLNHCGACNTACNLSGGSESCSTGACTLTTCDTGVGNCDNSNANGCETTLTSITHCGGCNVACTRANATADCGSGSCAIGTCNSGRGDCDGNDANGCEATLGSTDNNCGCGEVCAQDETCSNFACRRPFTYTTSNFSSLDPAIVTAAPTTLNCGVSTFDSNTMAFTNWCGQATPTPSVQSQSGGPDVVILAFDGLTVASGATLQLTGNRPVIIAVYGSATVSGTIDASASGATPGPGGDLSCGSSRGTDGTFQTNEGRGGGGGGFRGNGGNGGNYSGSQLGGPGGVSRGVANVQPLIGGCGGGHGGGCTNGAAGGGAVQLSISEMLSVTGTIRSNGGTGINDCGGQSAGGGGGSGGAVVLEADALNVAGNMVAARGGNGGNGNGGNGGAGSTSGATPNGSVGSTSNDGAGGGGGAYGRIHLRGVTSCTHALPSVSVAGTCS